MTGDPYAAMIACTEAADDLLRADTPPDADVLAERFAATLERYLRLLGFTGSPGDLRDALERGFSMAVERGHFDAADEMATLAAALDRIRDRLG